jgi:phosphocarrier protein
MNEEMIRTVKVSNRLGLHARPAAQFVRVASGFDCKINVQKPDYIASAKSIMGIMALGAACGTEFEIVAEGPDAEEALDALENLLANLEDEDTVENEIA